MVSHIRTGHVRFAVLLAVVLVVALTGVSVVSAHANLVDASPSSGEQLAESPDELVLTYSEGVQIADVSVESAEGDRVDGDARIDETDRAIVHVPFDELDNGTYVVQWEVLSVDGHTTSGSFFFVVGDEPPDREQLLSTYGSGGMDEDGGVPLLETLIRSAYLGGTIVLVGLPLTLAFAVYPAARSHGVAIETGDQRTRRLLGGAALALLLSVIGLGVVQFPEQRSVSVAALLEFFGTDLGRTVLVQMGSVLGVGALVAAHLRRPDRLRKPWLFAGAVALGLWLQVLLGRSSHSAAVNGTVGHVTDVGHLVGAAVWVGGLVALAVVAPQYLQRADDARVMAVQLIRRFTVLAAAGVVVAGATGLVLAGWHLPGVASLGTTRYGSALSIKTVLVLLAVTLGGLNRFLLVRHLRERPDRSGDREPVWAGPASVLSLPSRFLNGTAPARTFVRSVRLELVVLLVVLLLSGMITAIPTAADVTAAGEEVQTHEFESETAAGEVTVRVVPGHVGPNVFDVEMTRNGTTVDTDEPVTLILRNPDRGVRLPEVELDRLDDGTYSTVEPIPSAGVWEVRVTTWADGSYVSERFEMNVSDTTGRHETSGDGGNPGTGDDRLGTTLRYGAVGLLLVGSVGVGYEVRQLWCRKRE